MNIVKILFLCLLTFYACAPAVETAKEPEPEVFVFDDVPEFELKKDTIISQAAVNDTLEEVLSTETVEADLEFIVQIGAFTSKERAEKFLREILKHLKWEYKVKYNNELGLFVIQLNPVSSRTEAEEIRNYLWQFEKLKDAFIVTNRQTTDN